jgi:hypothetical protein
MSASLPSQNSNNKLHSLVNSSLTFLSPVYYQFQQSIRCFNYIAITMKHLLILALWSAGALGGSCQTAETSGALSSSQGPDECHDEIAETLTVSLVEIQPEQDTAFAAPVATDSPDDRNGQASMSVTFTEVGQASSVADDPGLPPPG